MMSSIILVEVDNCSMQYNTSRSRQLLNDEQYNLKVFFIRSECGWRLLRLYLVAE
jgi:hypothetical protein